MIKYHLICLYWFLPKRSRNINWLLFQGIPLNNLKIIKSNISPILYPVLFYPGNCSIEEVSIKYKLMVLVKLGLEIRKN